MLKEHIAQQVQEALQKIGISESRAEIDTPANSQFGDYTSTIAMQLAKELKKNPFEIAESIAKNILPDEVIEKVEVLRPGFVNFWIKQEALLTELSSLSEQKKYKDYEGKKYIFEYTDPNPFKEFHIGHLYTNTVGESVARLHIAVGADVRRVNYQGDVGLHVAKSIWGMRKKMTDENTSLESLSEKKLEERINFLGQSYAVGATVYEEDINAQEEIKNINYLVFISAQDNLKETQNWEPQVDYRQYLKDTELDYEEVKNLYTQGRKWSLEYFEKIYKRVGSKFDFYYFESVVAEYGMKIVKEFLEKGTFIESDGAVVFPGEKYGLHTRVFINSLGLPTYETKELGLAPTKYKDFQYDQSVIITANEIDDYFRVLIAALKQVSPELGHKTKHLSHGVVRLKTGKMSSRTGKIITGESLLDEVKNNVISTIEEGGRVAEDKVVEVSDALSVAAVKWAFLKTNIGKDVIFDIEESLAVEGNSGPYIQYTYARCKSILEKVGQSDSEKLHVTELNTDESNLLRSLVKFNEVIYEAAKSFAPHLISNYLFDLAQKFNVFYQKNNVMKSEGESKKLRLQLTESVSDVMKKGLDLLGIQTVEKM